MPLITSSLKTMRIHSRPPAAFLQAYREACAEGEMCFTFAGPEKGFEHEYSGLLFDVDSTDKEIDDDIKIVLYDRDNDNDPYSGWAVPETIAEDRELQWFLSDILILFSHEEPDYILLSASASAGATFDESEPTPKNDAADGDEE